MKNEYIFTHNIVKYQVKTRMGRPTKNNLLAFVKNVYCILVSYILSKQIGGLLSRDQSNVMSWQTVSVSSRVPNPEKHSYVNVSPTE